MLPPNPQPCAHTHLQLLPSPFASPAGFIRPDARKRLAATTASNRAPKSRSCAGDETTFPAPLVLPHDELNYDPDYPPQSFREWLHEGERNAITPDRKTLYIASIPEIDDSVAFMRGWTQPDASSSSSERDKEPQGREFGPPDVQEVVAYLRAFYHGLRVTYLPTPLRWTTWAPKPKSKRVKNPASAVPKYVALQYGESATRIRVRPSPDGVFPVQLNLNDILDAVLAILPADAYSVLLLVNHDLYESASDDFCCGRAYGGSRIAVVQSARYNPALDARSGIDTAHAWPMSHCRAYVDALCAVEGVEGGKPTKGEVARTGPMRLAVDAAAEGGVGRAAEEGVCSE